MADLSSDIETAAVQPKAASVDGTNVQARTIDEMIRADEYLAKKTGQSRNHLGLTFRKLIPSE